MKVVATEKLTKIYSSGTRAVDQLDLEVEQGCIFGLLGPNGAGKTSTVRLLNGSLEPTSGRARVLGMASGQQQVRHQSATLTERAELYASLTVEANLRFFADMYDMERIEAGLRIQELLDRLNISELRDTKIGVLSTGLRKRVQLARALLHRPRLVFLDEPTSGLDPEAALKVTSLIEELTQTEETTVFLCTHNLPLAEKICDRFGFIRDGRLVASGTKEQLVESTSRGRSVTILTTAGARTHPYTREQEITLILQREISQGASILEVRRDRPSLEEVYFHYVGREEDEQA